MGSSALRLCVWLCYFCRYKLTHTDQYLPFALWAKQEEISKLRILPQLDPGLAPAGGAEKPFFRHIPHLHHESSVSFWTLSISRQSFQHIDRPIYFATVRTFPVAIAFLCFFVKMFQDAFSAFRTYDLVHAPEPFQKSNFSISISCSHIAVSSLSANRAASRVLYVRSIPHRTCSAGPPSALELRPAP